MRALFVVGLLCGCVPDPCAVARRNVTLGAYDRATRATLPPTITADGITPMDVVCETADDPCSRAAFTLVGAAAVTLASDGYQPLTLQLDGGSQAECGREVPTVAWSFELPMTLTQP
jgi:hypothetical protein